MLRALAPCIALALLSSACTADDGDGDASETAADTTAADSCAAILDAEGCDARSDCITVQSQVVQTLGEDMYCLEAETTFLSCAEISSCEDPPYQCMGDSTLFLSYGCFEVAGYGDCPAPFDGSAGLLDVCE